MNASLQVRPETDAATLLRQPALSNCLALVGDQPEAAADALPTDLRAQLPAIVEAARRALDPAPAEHIVSELTRALSLGMGAGMSEAEKTEFYIAAAEELEALPAEWAIEGIRQARRQCKFRSELVTFVIRYAEDYPARDRARLGRLEALCAAAGVSLPGETPMIENK